LAHPAAYATELGTRAEDLGINVLLPITDPAVDALLEHRQVLGDDVIMPFPGLAIYRAASDKQQVLERARRAGFGIPETRVIRSPAEFDATSDSGLFPGVVKPHRSVVPVGATRRKVGVSFVTDSDSCRRVLRALPSSAFPVLLQRRVSGPGEGLFVLRWDGRTVAVFAHRRLREKPPAGGVSVYRESIAPAAELVDAGLRLLDALDWRGVAMIECKRELSTGRHVIMEVNGRFWGSLQLAIDAGVDFPTLLVRCALGQHPPAQGSYRLGVRSRWFWGDVDHLYLRLTRSAATLQLENGRSSRLGALIQFLRFRPGRDRSEIWRWRDPAPFLVETLQRLGVAR
jgi:predicted ATP-grasp superfamily ATP-dependent carboligase